MATSGDGYDLRSAAWFWRPIGKGDWEHVGVWLGLL